MWDKLAHMEHDGTGNIRGGTSSILSRMSAMSIYFTQAWTSFIFGHTYVRAGKGKDKNKKRPQSAFKMKKKVELEEEGKKAKRVGNIRLFAFAVNQCLTYLPRPDHSTQVRLLASSFSRHDRSISICVTASNMWQMSIISWLISSLRYFPLYCFFLYTFIYRPMPVQLEYQILDR